MVNGCGVWKDTEREGKKPYSGGRKRCSCKRKNQAKVKVAGLMDDTLGQEEKRQSTST